MGTTANIWQFEFLCQKMDAIGNNSTCPSDSRKTDAIGNISTYPSYSIVFLFVLFSLLPQLSNAKMDPMSQVFCLKWTNHKNNLETVLDHLHQTEAFCDVTLACNNTSINCHKMILSACSSYFQTLFMENNCEHPIVFLKDIKIGEVIAILDYMYKGEVNVAQEELPGMIILTIFIKVTFVFYILLS